jgi:hypothetical protein
VAALKSSPQSFSSVIVGYPVASGMAAKFVLFFGRQPREARILNFIGRETAVTKVPLS